jgi:tRNA 2-(methylsulfanyl)-N6-isopentenyladenosine37 hydroxylase
MLGLKLETDPQWANIAQGNISEILTDHAWCEQKAASNAISIVVGWPEHHELVKGMVDIAQEELAHFRMVLEKITERGYILGRERKDGYVNELYKFMQRGGSRETSLTERLLFAAMIEARSCERFRVLSENINDPSLAEFYRELMISEATHYTTFIGFARQYGNRDTVDERWKQWLEYESAIIRNYGKTFTIHG